MKIYSIKADLNSSQLIMPELGNGSILKYTVYDCTSKAGIMSEVEWKIYEKETKRGNFFSLGSSGGFAFDEDVYYSDLRFLIEMSGEIIPIEIRRESYYIMNVLECINALDKQNSERDIYPDGSEGRILKYSFRLEKLGERSIFKIPETCRGETLTYTGLNKPSQEFKNLYVKLGFSGLVFKEVYSSF